jgi:hypothetical protein
MSEQFRIWKKLDSLISNLLEIYKTFASIPKNTPNLVPFENLRQLTEVNRKSRTANTHRIQKQPDPAITIPPDVKDSLSYFGIPPPASERALQNALERLQRDEMIKVLQAVVDSFPCRPCYENSVSDIPNEKDEDEEPPPEEEVKARGSMMFTGLFGVGLGIWRIFLSAQALKDLEDAKFEGKPGIFVGRLHLADSLMRDKLLGNFEHIESKLIQLASGDWQRKSLCGHTGSHDERKSCHGILYQAIYGKNGRVLWQVDVEFDEQSGIVKQLVKGRRANPLCRGEGANVHVASVENRRCQRGNDNSTPLSVLGLLT